MRENFRQEVEEREKFSHQHMCTWIKGLFCVRTVSVQWPVRISEHVKCKRTQFVKGERGMICKALTHTHMHAPMRACAHTHTHTHTFSAG